jgi:GH24 family phage-related lysozyme (muramidase)
MLLILLEVQRDFSEENRPPCRGLVVAFGCIGRLASNPATLWSKNLHISNFMVDPQDVFHRSWGWQEIPPETAHVRCCFAPVVVIRNPSAMRFAELLSSNSCLDSFYASPQFQARFFTQVGTGKTTTAASPLPRPMGVSTAAIDFIGRGYENPTEKGFDRKTQRYFPYDDNYGYPTIGYGHLIHPSEDFSKGVTVEQVRRLLNADLAKTVAGVNKQLKVGVTQNQFDAIISLDFNVGLFSRAPGWTKKHHVLQARQPVEALNHGRAVREEDFTVYAKAHDKHHGNKVVFVKGLLIRRKAEWNIFSKNVYDSRH